MFRKWDFRPRPWWAPFPLVYSSFKRRRQTTGGNGRRVARVEDGMSTSSIKTAVSDSSAVRPNHKPSLFYYALSRANVAIFTQLTDSLPRSSMTQRRRTCLPTRTETLPSELRARSMRGCTMCCCVKRASDDAADPGHRTPPPPPRAPSSEAAEAEDEMRRLPWSWRPP